MKRMNESLKLKRFLMKSKSNKTQYTTKKSPWNQPVNFIGLRISNPYGGNFGGYFKSGFINNALHKLVINSTINIWGDGQQIRDYIHILDLCEYIKRVLEISRFQLINIGTGKGSNLISKL